MTFRPSAPHKRSRWLALFVVATTLLVLAGSFASAHGATSVPARYAGGTLVDSDPPPAPSVNDEPSQVDMTQMGRDSSVNPIVRIFWSWDAISAWTGKGQTGDACALFDDDDADANIDYVICARVSNPGADPQQTTLLPAAEDKPAYLFDCSNAKNDRCTQPTPRPYNVGQVLAGPLGSTLTSSGAGNLQNETDPFDDTFADGPGEAYPHDTSIEIEVASSLVPTGVRLANVCSYPSAGNGGNNNPFDCIVTPGVQYGTLRVTKVVTNDNGGTATAANFSFAVNGGTATAFEADGTNDLTVAVGNYSVLETVKASGYTESYANSLNSNTNCTSLAVTAGNTTTCTITNNDQAATLIVKKLVINDNGGTAVATDFTFQVNGGTAVTFLQDPNDADTKKGENTLTVDAGSYTVTEPAVSGYSTSYSNCTSVVIANGGSATCTITNDDDVPSRTISTTMSWTLHDSATINNFQSGGDETHVTFTLYKDTDTETSCEASTEVGSETVPVDDDTGIATTTTGFLVTEPGTYRWIASFDGNQFNAGIASACGDEITTITTTE